jgi:hypothetical protein
MSQMRKKLLLKKLLRMKLLPKPLKMPQIRKKLLL